MDQGRFEPTRIGRGTRIGNLCWVAHNVQIGEDTIIIGVSILAGSVSIGDTVYVAPSVGVREHREVGSDAFVGVGTVVVKDVAPGETVAGVPAKPFDRG